MRLSSPQAIVLLRLPRSLSATLRFTEMPSTTAAVSLAPLIVDGAMNGDLFVAWLEQELFSHMTPGHSLILDNLRVHKVEEVEAAAAKARIQLSYLPPYSPDLSAIEPMWSKVKAILRKIGATTKEELEKALCQDLDAVTSENILNGFRHCGYTCDV